MKVRDPRLVLNFLHDRNHVLPLGIVYLTDKCNSRCVMCDYWKNGNVFLSIEQAGQISSRFDALSTRWVLLSGGEPLLHPQWGEIADVLSGRKRSLWLLTAGLSLRKHAGEVIDKCENITVSLDGATPDVYESIRGLDAFDEVCAGIRAVVKQGRRVSIRCTVQRRNFRQLPELIDLAHDLGVDQISFLAIDTLTHAAFARKDAIKADLSFAPEDLPEFERILCELTSRSRSDFETGFVAESPAKLMRLHQYFSAMHGLANFPQVRCNAPRFSSVFTAGGFVQPCYFIEPEEKTRDVNAAVMSSIRRNIRSGKRAECNTCVCSMYRSLPSFVTG